ncbi:S8 family peptidase [Clostridium sp. LIBA-8841]|uniref:S8 family peptidase n=1 Tax=Clostridium sp. LIBA-8841 TaxID=2987530 RepID=UPI002AC6234C|nr:S8 family peptidase [Clostridium sp. LIBA-8841]MDZ5252264.1 S8 family peptidase [Clostridium sp. LIBA-8841]
MKQSFYNNPDFINLLVEYFGDIQSEIENIPNASIYIIDEKIAILSLKESDLENLLKKIQPFILAELGTLYTLENTSPVEASSAITFHRNPYLTLTGTDVIIGMVDTGIDYLNNEFLLEDDTTRILYLWDQTIDTGKVPDNMLHGSEYSKEDINRAITLFKEGGDPYTIVPSRDEIGHGTKMASIAGGRGRNRDFIGAAPNCDFIIVKLEQASKNYANLFFPQNDIPMYSNTDIILAVKYLYEKSIKLQKPIVIYIGLGGNLGPHSGESNLERYINRISTKRGIIVVSSSGNQGNTDTHTSNIIPGTGLDSVIEISVGKEQKGLVLQIYGKKPDKFTLSITSPSGESIKNITVFDTKLGLFGLFYKIKFIYEGTSMEVAYDSPDEFTGDESILIRADNIAEGIWKFTLTGEYIVYGKYNAWLLQRELLAPDTKFLAPTKETTLTEPGTCTNIICTAYYDQNNNALVSSSGQGFTRNDIIQPIIAAGGINAIATKPGGGASLVSGGSVAAAVTAGCCAILLQWSIVDGNNPTMYAPKLQTYLIRGARKRPNDIYPNRNLGYGILDVVGTVNSLRLGSFGRGYSPNRNLNEDLLSKNDDSTETFNVNNLFIRIPK